MSSHCRQGNILYYYTILNSVLSLLYSLMLFVIFVTMFVIFLELHILSYSNFWHISWRRNIFFNLVVLNFPFQLCTKLLHHKSDSNINKYTKIINIFFELTKMVSFIKNLFWRLLKLRKGRGLLWLQMKFIDTLCLKVKILYQWVFLDL